MADLVERLRTGEWWRAVVQGSNPTSFSTDETETARQAAERIVTLEAEAHENARLLGMGGEREANLHGEIERLKRDLARAEAEASEGDRLREALVALRGFMPPAGDDRVDEVLRLADAALIPEAPVREGWMPIETAPRDGSEIILHDRGTVGTGFYSDAPEARRAEAGWFWEDDRGNLVIAKNAGPTHWRPLPPPPQDHREG